MEEAVANWSECDFHYLQHLTAVVDIIITSDLLLNSQAQSNLSISCSS